MSPRTSCSFALAFTLLGSLAVLACAKDRTGERSELAQHSAPAAAGIIPIQVNENGFSPSRLPVKKGDRTTLRFTRTTDTTCAKEVVFPDLGVTKPLPLNQAVDIELPTDQPRELAFQCGMGMYRGAVVVN